MSKIISTMLKKFGVVAAIFAFLIALPGGVSEAAQQGQNGIRNLNQSKLTAHRHADRRLLTVNAAWARAQDLGEGFEPHDCVNCYRYYYQPYSHGYTGYYGVWPPNQN